MSGKSPPLSMRLRLRHWVVVDCVVAAGCGLLMLAILFRPPGGPHSLLTPLAGANWPLRLLTSAGLAVPVAVRRLWPLPALAVVLAATVVVMAAGHPLTNGPALPMMLVLYLVAAARRRPAALAGLAVTLAVLVAQALLLHLAGSGFGNVIGVALLLIIVWLIGDTMRQRRDYAAHLRAQAADAAVTDERLRIARELHDVVAHSMTVVAVQAGFGEYVFDSQPADARAALGAIQAVTREALADMQRLLGVLRQAAPAAAGPPAAGPPGGDAAADAAPAGARPPAPLAPAPGLGGLERLADSVTRAGVKVDLRRDGELRGLPPGIDLAAYRIIQEALTNVVKHSGADSCQVTVGCGPGGLSIEVTDPGPAAAGPAAGTGHGITGMRERVTLCGGDFSAGPVPGGGFRVTARLPLDGEGR
ncbi:MAG: sensor histidine kinase [Gemmatimonadota bacterium]